MGRAQRALGEPYLNFWGRKFFNHMQKGFINLIVISIVLAIVLSVAGYFVVLRNQKAPGPIQPSLNGVSPVLPSLNVGEDIIVTGLVTENDTSCIADGLCILKLNTKSGEINVLYNPGRSPMPCINAGVTERTLKIKNGDKVEIRGKVVSADSLSTCDSKMFYIKPFQNTTSSGDTRTSVKVPTSLNKLDPAPPADQSLAEITVFSQTSDGREIKIRVDKLQDYIRYPAATNPQLKVGDIISIHFNGLLDTFQDDNTVCLTGYIKNPKPVQAESAETPPGVIENQPKVTIGEKYLSKLFGCFAESYCQTAGWSGWLYNPSPRVIEYECVKQGTTSPSVAPQSSPSVEPQR